jgi:alpha-amylase/alpha-mannosidase (GH57 family)
MTDLAFPGYICIHGHFYQPPRENPWLEYVENQESAHPFHDWNEKITEECYTPNRQARILDEEGRLTGIINNYEHISFDFGPTLLSWLEEHAIATYNAVLEADAASVKRRCGHGNALAQAYNHMIMPLASIRDKITQVVWGIKDFRKRFRRDPEGMWLPETAVDLETLEILADNGIYFTVLSPRQAKRFRSSSKAPWVDINPGSVDPSRPYRCPLSHNLSISIFFYDAPISQAIAFENLLNNGEEFRKKLLGGFSAQRTWPQLVNIATDGESYGHHHRFGEMALAFALDKILNDPGAKLTNYGEFLEKYSPTQEVEFIEKSSWSCAHGLGRWSEDCGCSSGMKADWNQKWRVPLRKAMDLLRDRADEVFIQEGSPVFIDPWAARNNYIEVILEGHGNADEFLKDHTLRPIDSVEVPSALSLLEMERNRMLMYTSCGWFFDDISGIESLQILRYAARVLEFASPYDSGLSDDFLTLLSQAYSNVMPQPRGDEIFKQRILPQVADLDHVAAHAAISSGFENVPIKNRLYCYDISLHDLAREQSGERALLLGQISVRSRITMESKDFVSAVIYLGEVDLRCSVAQFSDKTQYDTLKQDLLTSFYRHSSTELIRKMDKYFPGPYFSMKDLFSEQRIRIIEAATNRMYSEQAGLFEVFYKNNKDFARLILNHDARLPDTFLAAASFVLNRVFLRELEKLSSGFYPDELEGVLEEARFWKIQPDLSAAGKLIRSRIMSLVSDLAKSPGDEKISAEIIKFLDLGKNLDLALDLGEVQILFLRIARYLEAEPKKELTPMFLELAERLLVRLNNH